MVKLYQLLPKNLSVRISLLVVLAVALLLTAALSVMLYYSRKAVRDEAFQNADQTLDTTMLRVDNILLSVEQSSGNIYWSMLSHLDNQDRMFLYCRKLIETNPFITGAAIAFNPDYYKRPGELFMAYVHRPTARGLTADTSHLIEAQTFGNRPYTEQSWYKDPVESGRACWINPLKNLDAKGVAVLTYSLPIYNRQGRVVGVLGVDVALELLSNVVLAAKPSPHSYAMLIDGNGSYIVHPDSNELLHHDVFSFDNKGSDRRYLVVARAMMTGETGHRHITLNDSDYYMFYKPFTRTISAGRVPQDLSWSIAIVYPEGDIFSDYNRQLYTVLVIVAVSLLLMAVFCRVYTNRQLLPLRMLSVSAQHIAGGNYDDHIPVSHQQDEVGQLQKHFQQMQRALAHHIDKLQSLSVSLRERGTELVKALEQAKNADKMKTAFLHNMSNKMIPPITSINESMEQLSQVGGDSDIQLLTAQLSASVMQQGEEITSLLNDVLTTSLAELNTPNHSHAESV